MQTQFKTDRTTMILSFIDANMVILKQHHHFDFPIVISSSLVFLVAM